MTRVDIAQCGPRDEVTRLRELLAQLEKAAPLPRSDPRSLDQLALCAEVESIVRKRFEERAAQRTG